MPKLAAGFRFLSSEARTLERAVSILAASAFLSSLLALFRDRLLAHTFGAGVELDLYYAAFRIPDFLFVTVGALVSVYILIPEFTRREGQAQKNYIDTVVAGFSLLAVSVSIVAAFATPFILERLFPVFAGTEYMGTLVLLTRILLLQPILLGLSNILAAITQVRARYGLYALSPILYNVGIIAGILLLYPLFGLGGLAWGVVLGAALHLGIQAPSIFKEGFFHSLPRLIEPISLVRTMSISIPRALALSLNQVTFIGLTALAATLAPGSIAIFMFAYNLNNVPLAVIGASYSVAAFPTLAAAFANGRREEFVNHVAIAARHVIFWSLPAIALIVVLRAHVVRVVLGSGAFDWTDTRLTAAALAIFSLGLAAQGIQLLLIRGYYAAGKTFVPLVVSLFSTIGTILTGIALIHAFAYEPFRIFIESLMRVEYIAGSSILALSLAYALVAVLSAFILSSHFDQHFGGFFKRVRKTYIESTFASFGGGFAAYMVLYVFGPLTVPSTLISIFLKGFAAGIAGIIVTALLYWLFGNREYEETVTAIRSRIWRTPPEGGVSVVASAEEGPANH